MPLNFKVDVAVDVLSLTECNLVKIFTLQQPLTVGVYYFGDKVRCCLLDQLFLFLL